MYYIIQENCFSDRNYDKLENELNRLTLPYEVVDVKPSIETIDFKTKRTDIFPFGSLKMARVSKQYGWKPGSQMNENHDFNVYKNYYKENLLNYDSKIIKFGDDFYSDKLFFARPTLDSKVLTGRVYDIEQWDHLKDENLKHDYGTSLNKDIEIQISSVKKLQKEIRMWIVKGEIVTASQYRLGSWISYNENVDKSAYDFCNKMIKLFELNDAFVMDVCLVEVKYKIVECGCINCCGFYDANIQKLLMKLEDSF